MPDFWRENFDILYFRVYGLTCRDNMGVS